MPGSLLPKLLLHSMLFLLSRQSTAMLDFWPKIKNLYFSASTRPSEFRSVKLVEDHQDLRLIFESGRTSLIASYNSQRCLRCFATATKLLKELKDHPRLEDKDVRVFAVDMANFAPINEYYLTKLDGLVMVVDRTVRPFHDYRGILYEMGNFKEEHTYLLERALAFIEDQLDSIPTAIMSQQQLEEVLKRRTVVSLYIGKSDNDFEAFMDFAHRNAGFPFFYILREELATYAFRKYRGMPYHGGNYFALLRSEGVLDEFDSYQMVFLKYDQIVPDAERKSLFLMEKHPKVRREAHVNSVVESAFNGFTVLLYVKSAAGEAGNLREFLGAVQRMEKRAAFCHLSIDSQEFQKLKTSLGIESFHFEPENVYLIYYGEENGFSVREMMDGFSVYNIMFFMNNRLEKEDPQNRKRIEKNDIWGENASKNATLVRVLLCSTFLGIFGAIFN